MAIIILGSSECPLCGKVLLEGQEITGLPPSSFRDHPLYHYFDSGFHQDCFDNWDKKGEALQLKEEDINQFKASDAFKEAVKKYGLPDWLK